MYRMYRMRFFASGAFTLVLAALVVLSPATAAADQAYAGVWRGGTDGYAMWVGDDWGGFVAQWDALAKQGLRLIDLETDVQNGQRRYSGVWRQGNDGYALWVGDTWAGFTAKWAELSRQGLRLIDFETYVESGQRVYAGVFREGNDAYALWVGDDWNGFVAQWSTLASQGLRLIDLETHVENGRRRYSGVWRAGTDGYALWVGDDWNGFMGQWNSLSQQGLRLIDLETYVDNGQRKYSGVWRAGGDAYTLWVGVDWENFVSRWHEWADDGLRLIDLERYPGCSDDCANQVVADSSYNYWVTGHDTWYRWPVDTDSGGDWVRNSAINFSATPFMEIPFADTLVKRLGTWRYHNGNYHHAIDYARDDWDTFPIGSTAAGTVIYQGWDNWAGNTVIVSHTVDGVADAFRSVYMHLRNGAAVDCDRAWTDSVPSISGDSLTDYETHLTETGCSADPANRNLDASHWGTNLQTLPNLVGQEVTSGQFLGVAGNTGPGGKRGSGGPNTHLHLFTTRLDPTDGEYYFVDPYGIYGGPDCYPTNITDSVTGACARYPNLWVSDAPRYPDNPPTRCGLIGLEAAFVLAVAALRRRRARAA